MFTPEFTSAERGEFVLVANHSLETAEAASLSVEYNAARIRFGLAHVPETLQRCRLVYDLRGQKIEDRTLERVRSALKDICDVEFRQ